MDGLKRCFICKEAPAEPRYSYCAPCKKEKLKAWRLANREHVLSYASAYHKRNYEKNKARAHVRLIEWRKQNGARQRAINARYFSTEKARATKRAYCAANKDQYRRMARRWKEANRERVRSSNAKYRATERGRSTQAAHKHRRRGAGNITSASVRDVLREANGMCAWCSAVNVKITVDHVIPIARGGTNERGNLVGACLDCNVSRGKRLPSEWVPRYWRDRIAAEAKAC